MPSCKRAFHLTTRSPASIFAINDFLPPQTFGQSSDENQQELNNDFQAAAKH